MRRGLLILSAVLTAALGVSTASGGDAEGVSFRQQLAAGYDTYVQSYYLAVEDTTETIEEFELSWAGELAAAGRRRHAWSLQPRLATGSERDRARLSAQYVLRPDSSTAVLRLDADLNGVRYRGATDYNLSSDYREGLLRGRWTLSPHGATAIELHGRVAALRYTDASALEVDRNDRRAGLRLVSGRDADDRWRLGAARGARSHPDTAAIDRDEFIFEAEYDHPAFLGPGWRVHQISSRRKIADTSVRPSSWSHWTDAEFSLPLGDQLRLGASLDLELWRYDDRWGAYDDQTRWDGTLRLEGGGFEGPSWRAGLAAEHLDSTAEDERYAQLGVVGGLDHFTDRVSLSFTLEIGQRDYADPATVDPDITPLYTDFTYVELWLTGSVDLSDRLRLDALANYLPENHAEDIEDTTLGFGSLRLVYRF